MANGLLGPPSPVQQLGPPTSLMGPREEPQEKRGFFRRLTRAAGDNSLLGFIGNAAYGPREEVRLQNDLLRNEVRSRQRRSEAAARLPGILSGEEQVSQPELMGLLAEVLPAETAQGLLGQFFPQEGRTPTPVIQAAQFAHPNDPGKQREFVLDNFRQQGATDEMLRAIELQFRTHQLEQARREREQAQESADRAKRETAVSIRNDINRARRLAETNRELAGTFLEPGRVLPDIRRSGTAAFIEALEGLGVDQSERRRILQLRDNFNKDAANFLIESLDRMQGSGTITNQKFEALRSGVADLGTSVGTNSAILADSLEALLVAAEIEDVSGVDQDEIRTLIDELRGVPSRGSKPPQEMTQEELDAEIRALGGNNG